MARKKKTTQGSQRSKRPRRGGTLVIVESPAKARTLKRYLGDDYVVKASVGHVRDLPKRELGVDVEKGFEPTYVTIHGKGKVLKELKEASKGVHAVLLATDPDREGEAIAYHVAEQLGYPGRNGDRFQRVRFHEITRRGVEEGLSHPGEIDVKKVEAQQARRILDRLVGYQASPFLWKPIRPGLSAGRVQTVALRLIWEREDAIRRFQPKEYWTVEALLEKDSDRFTAQLHFIDGHKPDLPNEDAAKAAEDAVRDRPFVVSKVRRKERRKFPAAPFTTSTLQQEASKQLGFSAAKTMRIAQQLYEGVDLGEEGPTGLITYMRTDSTRVAASAAEEAREHVAESFGDRYLPSSANLYTGKQQKGAQEAHEAIRPTGVRRTPESVQKDLHPDQAKLYRLVWLRFVASQMAPAVYDTTTLDFDLEGSDGRAYLFRATGSILKFDGFTRLYREGREQEQGRSLDDLKPLPVLEEGAVVTLIELSRIQHFTEPPPRFSEASLVKELERLGIGRPSTYASIISTLLQRTYVELQKRRFHATVLGETVAQVLIKVFPDIFNVGFTSEMEQELDKIEDGELAWRKVLEDFYGPFQRQLAHGKEKGDEIVREIVQAKDEVCEKCGRPMLVRWNRYGRFLGCSGYPDCRNTKTLDEPPDVDLEGETCPQCGGDLVAKTGRFGPFVACANYPDCRFTRPIESGQVLQAPETPCPKCGSALVVKSGRYGPFIACSAYPNCKHTQPITTGIKCPRCGEGELAQKRTRRGKVFFGCTRYPDCDFSMWSPPVETECPACGSKLALQKSTKRKGDYLKCVSCGHEFQAEEQGTPEAQEASVEE